MRSKTGTVTSKSGNKSIVVETHYYREHPKYKKQFRVSKKFHAHDEENAYKVGDKVTIYECRPLSKLKRWTTSAKPMLPAKKPANTAPKVQLTTKQ